jgi:8-oxo-dGTP pyrophosphatase MutT (NUDIX family)/phosphohistidine phosphatase SixA
MAAKDVLAAGAVVFRPGKRVLLIHRPRYDDWSFPKGKLDPGEHRTAAAVREVVEETGLHIRLGQPLAGQRYPIAGGKTKSVFYWVGRVVGDPDVSGYRPNDEIDEVRWVPYDEALDLLSHEHDGDTLRQAHKLRRKTRALVVLRHGHARSRKAWRQDDRLRPLVQAGREQAQRAVPILAAYDVTRLLSSSSTRCVDTVAPYADTTGWKLELDDALSEEGTTTASVRRLVDELVTAEAGTMICTHRPVLPAVFDALGTKNPGLEPGEMLVAHLRQGRVLATERHRTA